MDAGFRYVSRFSATLFVLSVGLMADQLAMEAKAADFRTQNFIVFAPSEALARSVGQAAEAYRHDLAEHWLGRTLPAWPQPCPIRVIAGNIPAQGVTTYNPNPVSNFQMEVVGTPERILDSVLPHEVTHTILATHFGRPLPRWADEGICTTVEHASERQKHEEKLREFLRTRRGIAMNKLFLLTEYPSDVLPMYAQGYSVCQFLIAQRGPQNFVTFLGDYMARPSWTENVKRHYGYESLAELQEQWLLWVSVGNGPVDRYAKISMSSSNVANGSGSSPRLSDGPTVALAAATDRPATSPAGRLASTGPQASVASTNLASDLTRNAAFDQRSAALASDIGDSWYLRKRRDAEAATAPESIGNPVSPSGMTRGTDPPSIYSAAHPQPEQGAVPSSAVHSGSAPAGSTGPSYPSATNTPAYGSSLWR
jgi:hypothetical protein